MIFWDRPIQAIDGRRAKVLSCVTIDRGGARAVYIAPSTDGGCGDVFIVNDEGHRCDDRAIYSKRQEPIVRNVPVKRKAWIRLPIFDYPKARTKEECEASITNQNYKAVYCEWEEEP